MIISTGVLGETWVDGEESNGESMLMKIAVRYVSSCVYACHKQVAIKTEGVIM